MGKQQTALERRLGDSTIVATYEIGTAVHIIVDRRGAPLCGVKRSGGKAIEPRQLRRDRLCPRCLQKHTKQQLGLEGPPVFGGAIAMPAQVQAKLDSMSQALEATGKSELPADYDEQRFQGLVKRCARFSLVLKLSGIRYVLIVPRGDPSFFKSLNGIADYLSRAYEDQALTREERAELAAQEAIDQEYDNALRGDA